MVSGLLDAEPRRVGDFRTPVREGTKKPLETQGANSRNENHQRQQALKLLMALWATIGWFKTPGFLAKANFP